MGSWQQQVHQDSSSQSSSSLSQPSSSASGNHADAHADTLPISHVNIFWPKQKARKSSGTDTLFIVGWTYLGGPGELNVVVCTFSPLEQVTRRKFLFQKSHKLGSSLAADDTYDQLQLVGIIKAFSTHHRKGKGKERQHDDIDDCIDAQYLPVWMTASLYDSHPVIHRIDVQCQSLHDPSIAILHYPLQPPLSLEPIYLTPLREQSKSEQQLGDIFEKLVASKPHRWFEVTGGFEMGRGPGAGLRIAVQLINHSVKCANRIEGDDQDITADQPIAMKSAAVRMVQGVARTISMILFTLNRLLIVIQNNTRSLNLHCVTTLRHRLDQLESLLRPCTRTGLEQSSVLLSIGTDIVLGIVLRSLILHRYTFHTLHTNIMRCLISQTIHNLSNALDWLDSWPVGLKLNTELSRFYRDMYYGLLTTFNTVFLSPLQTWLQSDHRVHSHSILTVITTTGGLSLLLSTYLTLLSLLTLHLTYAYKIANSQVNLLLSLLNFLLHLFKGTKQIISLGSSNTSRRKSVSVVYELDQLLLGTIAFTLMVFLSPTILAYAGLFSFVYVFRKTCITALQVGISILIGGDRVQGYNIQLRIAVLLHQVLHKLTLGKVGIHGISAGITLSLDDESPQKGLQATHVHIHPQTKSVAEILSAHL
ncbi:unnamed protein product [Sympodiomycopsis kandeliae]